MKSYLDRLKFDPRLENSFFGRYLKNIRLVILFVLIILIAGIFSYQNLPKRLNPEIKIPIVIVSTALPGASPEDIESLITIPIENELTSVKGIDTMNSTSRDNVSIISMQFFSSVTPEKAKLDVQSEIDALTTLPEDATTPTVLALDFEDQPIWTFALSTKEDPISLMTFADRLKQKLEDLAVVDRVVLNGFRTQEIAVIINPEKLETFGFNPLTVSSAIKAGLASYPAGQVQTIQNAYSLTIDPEVTSIEGIRETVLQVNDQSIKLGDIATVFERPVPGVGRSYLASKNKNPEEIVTFYIYKTQGENIDSAGKKIDEEVQKELSIQNDRFSIQTISNTAVEIEDQYTELLGEFQTTVLLIVLCLFIFLGLRQALLSSLTVPLTFLFSFFLMSFFGQSINFLTLFAFILALGLLIDDTIVVVSSMTAYYRSGKFTPYQTGLLVYRDTIVPIWSTTLTTIWSFVPLLLTAGIIGEFIKPLPIVVSTTMVASTTIAVFITLPLLVVLLKLKLPYRVALLLKILGIIALLAVLINIVPKNIFLPFIIITGILLILVLRRTRKKLVDVTKRKVWENRVVIAGRKILEKTSNHGIIDIESLAQKYYRLIIRVLSSKSSRRKVIFAIVIYAVIGFLLVPTGLVKNEFFPKVDQELLYVSVDLPVGTTIDITEKEMLKVADKLRKINDIEYVVSESGSQFDANFERTAINSSGILTFHLPKEKDRKRSSTDIAEELRDVTKDYTKGKVAVVELSGGPPAGADVQITLLGSELENLDNIADNVVTFLKTKPGVTNVEKSVKPGPSKITFVPDKSKLSSYGINPGTVGLWLRMFVSGLKVDEVSFGNKTLPKKDVTVHIGDGIWTPEDLTALSIPTNDNQYIPLSQLGEFTPRQNPSLITREDRRRSITISAGVLPGYNVQDVNNELLAYTGKLDLPENYEWKTGGVNEENQKSVTSILQAMIVAFVLITVTMVVQFQSYRQAAIVLMVIPLAVSSVFYVFAITGTPLSFPALIGVVSLFGIVVTNSMFIVDKININRKQGMEFKEAIADAGASRLEPIVLTKLNTVLGLLPITLADPLWRGLGGSIISGLVLASTIMLLFIPAVYYNWFNPKKENK